ncbi:MAG: DegV family protein, partial [Mycoplasmoidaceae bacterium]|nr:DegV family protein [Mycoplasmoidaceae bacterium]
LKLIISYDYEGLVFMDKSSSYEGCLKIIKKAFNKKIDLENHKVTKAIVLENSLNEKYHVNDMCALLEKEFGEHNIIHGKFPSVITAHVGVDYAAIILMVE